MKADNGVHTVCVRGGWGCRLKACRLLRVVARGVGCTVTYSACWKPGCYHVQKGPRSHQMDGRFRWDPPAPTWGKQCRIGFNLISACELAALSATGPHPGEERQPARKSPNAGMLRLRMLQLTHIFTQNDCCFIASAWSRSSRVYMGMTAAHSVFPWCVFGRISSCRRWNIPACPL